MPQANLEQIANTVASYVDASKLLQGSFSASYDPICGLLNKIGKTFTIDTLFFDDFTEMDGEKLEFGAILEEFYEDLIQPGTWDDTGANTLSPAYPTYRPTIYSYPFGLKPFKQTESYVRYKKACLNAESYGLLIAKVYKRLEDSIAVWKRDTKKEMLGKFIGKVEAAFSGASTVTANTAYSVGAYVKDASHYAVVFKAIPNTNTETDVADLVAAGYCVLIDNLKQVVAKPVDTETGEAFIKQLKNDVAVSRRPNENSLNGASIGAQEGLYLYVKEGVMSSLDVDTLAGAFNQERLAVPVTIRQVEDFGSYSGNAYAILIDPRGCRIHPNEDLTLNQVNAEGAFINIYRHMDFTGCISGNSFVKVYEAS